MRTLRRYLLFLYLMVIAISTVNSADAGRVEASQTQSLELEQMGSSAQFSRFGTYLGVITRSNTVRVYNSNFDQLWIYRGEGYHGTGPGVLFTPDEQQVLFPGYDSGSQIAIANAADGTVIDVLSDHAEEVKNLGLSSDGEWLVSTAYGGAIFLWRRDGDSFTRTQTLTTDVPIILDVEFSPDGRILAIANNADYVELFAREGDTYVPAGELRPGQYYGNTGYIQGTGFSPDGRWFAAGVRDEITIWRRDGDAFERAQVIPQIDAGYCYSLTFGPDSATLVGGFQASRTAFWKLNGEQWEYHSTASDRQDYIWDVAVSPDGTSLATVSVTGNGVALWSLEGVGPSPAVELALLAGGRLSTAQRRFVTDETAVAMLGRLDRELLAARDMFETEAEYGERIEMAGSQVALMLSNATQEHYGITAEDHPDGEQLVIRLDGAGGYDIDRLLYTIPLLGTSASLSLQRDEARDLFRNWEDARVLAIRSVGEHAGDYLRFELAHPTLDRVFPIRIDENPFSGEAIDNSVTVRSRSNVGSRLVVHDLTIGPVFPAMYRHYASHAVGTARFENSGPAPISDLKISVFVPSLMREPSLVAAPDSIAVGRSAQIDLNAAFEPAILDVEDGDVVTAILTISYNTEGSAHNGEIRELVTVLNRNAIQWDDDLRVAAFVAPHRDDIKALSTSILAAGDQPFAEALTPGLLVAMRVFAAMKAADLTYTIDPQSAYEELSQTDGSIDYLQFPQQTLSIGGGDCDDLSVLFVNLAEAAGIKSAFVTVPGHIFVAVDLGVPPEIAARIVPFQDDLIYQDNRVWLPVETTALRSTFVESWRIAARQWRGAKQNGNAALFTTTEGWFTYPPVGISESQLSSPVSPSDMIRPGPLSAQFQRDLIEYQELAIAAFQSDIAAGPASASSANRLGVLHARFGLFEAALDHFTRAIESDEFVPAMVNAANIHSINGNHDAAAALLLRANDERPSSPRVLFGLAVEYLEVGDDRRARSFYNEAVAIRPEFAEDYPIFGGETASGGARASRPEIIGTYQTHEWEDE